jgi:hypothetical protein
LVSDRILNTQNIFENILYGKNRDKLLNIITKHVEIAVDEQVSNYPMLKAATQGTSTSSTTSRSSFIRSQRTPKKH